MMEKMKMKMTAKKKDSNNNNNSSHHAVRKSTSSDLFKRGNAGMVRLLLIIRDTEPEGITTVKLLEELGSIGYGQSLIRRAEHAGYIKRKQGQSEHGHFAPVFNFITERGQQFLAQI